MNIYAFINTLHGHASYYYRMVVPLQTMEDLGLPVTVYVDNMAGTVPMERRRDGMMWSDIVWAYQATDPLMRRNIEIITGTPGVRAKADGKIWHPATWVIDSDDALFHVQPRNYAFRRLGIQLPDGRRLMPANSDQQSTQVIGEGPGGNPIVLWEDGKNGFNIRENISRLENYRMMCQTAGIMTCSTPTMESYLKKEIGKKLTTFVNPNSVRFDHYQDVALAPHKGIRIMWQGSNTHYEDMYDIHGAIERIANKYPEVTFVFWGEKFGELTAGIPEEQLEYIPWMPYEQYHLRLVTVGPDINICPLRSNTFGNCRSAIKFYEGSLLHDPAATIAARAGAYADEVEHGKTGLLYDTPDEFENQLCTLIENEKQRRELAANAKDWVHENRDAFKVAPKLFEFFQQIREEKNAGREIEDELDEPISEQQPDATPSKAKGSKSRKRGSGQRHATKGGRRTRSRVSKVE